jgi:hypothetical protein
MGSLNRLALIRRLHFLLGSSSKKTDGDTEIEDRQER